MQVSGFMNSACVSPPVCPPVCLSASTRREKLRAQLALGKQLAHLATQNVRPCLLETTSKALLAFWLASLDVVAVAYLFCQAGRPSAPQS